MAASIKLQPVLSQCKKLVLARIHKTTEVPIRYYAAPTTKFKKRVSKDVKTEKSGSSKEQEWKRTMGQLQEPIYGLTEREPTDDVYITKYYTWPVYEMETALEMLKKYQELDFTHPKQPVYINLKLDMALEKKKTVEPFLSTIRLPYPFTTETKKVLLFTEDAEEARLALEHGAAFVGGTELVKSILDDDIQADSYVAVPSILPKLNALRNKLKRRFPRSNRGSIGVDIPKMLDLFKQGHEFMVEDECFVVSQIATLDMPCEQILANSDGLIKNVCSHKPLKYGPLIERGQLHSDTSEHLRFNFERFLPRVEEEESDNES